MHVAEQVTIKHTTTAVVYMTGEPWLTLLERPRMLLPAANARPKPEARPAMTHAIVAPATDLMMAARVAPSAIRTAISFVRWDTRQEMTLYIPPDATRIAMAANIARNAALSFGRGS